MFHLPFIVYCTVYFYTCLLLINFDELLRIFSCHEFQQHKLYMLLIHFFNFSHVHCRFVVTPDFHVKVCDCPAVVCCTSLQPQFLLWADTNGRNTARLREPEVDIKLSDAFRGRYALPIGGPCPVLLFMTHKMIRGKKVKEWRATSENHFTKVLFILTVAVSKLRKEENLYLFLNITDLSVQRLHNWPSALTCCSAEMNPRRPWVESTAWYEWRAVLLFHYGEITPKPDPFHFYYKRELPHID